jgi:integrase/recombinase XerC
VRVQREDGIGGSSISQRLSALRGFFDWMVIEGIVPSNPARAVENPRFRKPLSTLLSASELSTLLDLPLRHGHNETAWRDAVQLRTLVWTGVRAGECSRLDWWSLDLTTGRESLTIVDGEGGRDRVMPVAGILRPSVSRDLGGDRCST